MQRYGQKTSKMPQKWGFSPICDPPRFFFKNRALSLLYPYGALTSCKKLEKTNEQSLRYLKTDGWTDERTDGQTDGQTDKQTDGRTDKWTNGRMDERTDERTDGPKRGL